MKGRTFGHGLWLHLLPCAALAVRLSCQMRMQADETHHGSSECLASGSRTALFYDKLLFSLVLLKTKVWEFLWNRILK